MAQLTDRLATAEERTDRLPVLPDALTWSATLDPRDESHEIEITDDMVRHAIAQIENEQVYPFRREAGTPAPVARPVTKADVIVFPGSRLPA